MKIEIKASMAKDEILDILKNVWNLPDEKKSKPIPCQDHSKLHDDIAAICSFLSDRQRVLDNLQPLDEAIRNELEKDERLALKAKVTQAIADNSGELLKKKNQKLLTGRLDEFEKLHHFNFLEDTAAARGKLHTQAFTAGDGNSAIGPITTDKFQPYNPDKKPVGEIATIDLPRGVPTLTGVLAFSFNPVLLKNGYHWKDPGADALVHGEFTHRIQWYAICNAAARGNLKLANLPIQVFKSMGWASFTGANNENEKVYLWLLCCDCFEPGQAAGPGQPRSTTYNCPNILHSYLSKAIGTAAWQELPYLKAVMAGRQLKRKEENNPVKTDEKIFSGEKAVNFAVTSPGDNGATIWWRKR